MQKTSFLLTLNGTMQSQYAAEAAWLLSEKSRARLVAQHVVDNFTPWELLRNDEPGFIGSGLSVNTFETLLACQRDNANRLVEKYEAMVAARDIDAHTVIDEGDPVGEICKRAKDFDLVIAGHRPGPEVELPRNQWHAVRYRVAEGLAHECPKPLLIVQKRLPRLWKGLRIVVSLEHLNISFIRACLRTALFLQAEPIISCLTTGSHEESVAALRKDLHACHPDLAHIPVETQQVDSIAACEKLTLWRNSASSGELDLEDPDDALLVVPTRRVDGGRRSVLGSAADVFVRRLVQPAILLWPEEAVHPEGLKEVDSVMSDAIV